MRGVTTFETPPSVYLLPITRLSNLKIKCYGRNIHFICNDGSCRQPDGRLREGTESKGGQIMERNATFGSFLTFLRPEGAKCGFAIR